MQIYTEWEDPFRQEEAKAARIITSRLPPIDIDLIRERQRNLLPFLNELYDEAAAAYRNASRIDRQTSKKIAPYRILFRRPDPPNILQIYAYQLEDYRVVLPVETNNMLPVIDNVFPIYDLRADSAFEDIVVFWKMEGLRLGKQVSQIRVVHLNMLGLLKKWVSEFDGPIHSVDYSGPVAPSKNQFTIVKIPINKTLN